MQYAVRPIKEADVPGYHRCLDEVARERRYLTFQTAPPLESSRAFVRRQLEHGAPMFVASDEDRIVGWCDIVPQDRPSLAHRGELGIGVCSGYRGQGIGRRLLQAALDAARSFGLERIELNVLTDNAPAIALYQTFGFEIEGKTRHSHKHKEGYGDDYIMALFIQ